MFPGISITVGYLLSLGLYFFYKVRFEHLGISENLQDSAPFLRVLLSVFFMLDVSWSRLQMFRQNFWIFSHELVCLSCLIFSGISVLIYGLSYHQTACLAALLWECFWWLGLRVRSVVSFWWRDSVFFGGTALIL